VDIFQRRSLIKRWHEDFPAVHDEGGRPGDTSAGIVAFIRERLVDIDPVEVQDEKDAMSDDIEAQNGMQVHSARQEVQLNCVPHMPLSLERDVFINHAGRESSTSLSRSDTSQEHLIWTGYRLDDIHLTD
jgi:hypothetical protein